MYLTPAGATVGATKSLTKHIVVIALAAAAGIAALIWILHASPPPTWKPTNTYNWFQTNRTMLMTGTPLLAFLSVLTVGLIKLHAGQIKFMVAATALVGGWLLYGNVVAAYLGR